MRYSTPKVIYSDSYTIGQISDMWDRSPMFVRDLIDQDLLTITPGGLVTNEELARFYRDSGTLLDVPPPPA